MPSADTAPGGESTAPQECTPLFDETLQTLPAPGGADAEAEPEAEPEWPVDDPEDVVDRWYGADPPEPAIDPRTREGRAIMQLFRMLKEAGEPCPPGRWITGDVARTVIEWLTSLGIDPGEHPMDVGQRLTLAARARPGQSLRATDYLVQIGTEHADAAAVLSTAMRVVADQLGPGTGLTVRDAEDEVIAHHTHPAISARA